MKYKLRDIEGKIFLFDIPGVSFRYSLIIQRGALIPLRVSNGREPDVIVRASASLFLKLITSRIDFDQAFFSRQLKIERDLVTALYLKNIIN